MLAHTIDRRPISEHPSGFGNHSCSPYGALEVPYGDPAGALTIRLGHSMDALYWGTHLNSKIASVPYNGALEVLDAITIGPLMCLQRQSMGALYRSTHLDSEIAFVPLRVPWRFQLEIQLEPSRFDSGTRWVPCIEALILIRNSHVFLTRGPRGSGWN